MVIKAKINSKNLKLSPKWVKKLVELPESGMGYQTVVVRLKNGMEIAGLTVLNCQMLVFPKNISLFGNRDIAEITMKGEKE